MMTHCHYKFVKNYQMSFLLNYDIENLMCKVRFCKFWTEFLLLVEHNVFSSALPFDQYFFHLSSLVTLY